MKNKTVGTCKNCNEIAIIAAKGRCNACNVFLWRNGIERPDRLINRQMFCQDCKEEPVSLKGRCNACHLFFITNGKTRHAHLRNKHKAICKNTNCRKPLRVSHKPIKGYCSPCYDYKRRRGVERPANVARFEVVPGYIACENPNCDKPIRFDDNWNSRKRRCSPCAIWLARNGEDRARDLCPQRVTEMGWCECGEIATVELFYEFGMSINVEGSMYVCGGCYEIEIDYQKEAIA